MEDVAADTGVEGGRGRGRRAVQRGLRGPEQLAGIDKRAQLRLEARGQCPAAVRRGHSLAIRKKKRWSINFGVSGKAKRKQKHTKKTHLRQRAVVEIEREDDTTERVQEREDVKGKTQPQITLPRLLLQFQDWFQKAR